MKMDMVYTDDDRFLTENGGNMNTTPEKSLEATLLSQMHLCGHIISHHTEESSSQRRLLNIIKKYGVASQSELVNAMGVRPPSMSALLSKLESRGYITRIKKEGDRRKLYISITEAGEAALEKMQREHERILGELFAALDKQERQDVSRLLQKLLTSWEPLHRELKKAYDPNEAKRVQKDCS